MIENRASFWEKISCLANVATAIFVGLSLIFLYTQTPLFVGARPRLEYFVDRSNSIEKDSDGMMWSRLNICVRNKSDYAAKDVNVVVAPLSKTGWSIKSNYPVEELTPAQGENRCRIIVVKTVPARSGVTLQCIERVARFKDVDDVRDADDLGEDMFGRRLPVDFPRRIVSSDAEVKEAELNTLAGNHCYEYFGFVLSVYTEHGPVSEAPKCGIDSFEYLPDDYRSADGQKRVEEFKRAMTAR